MRILGISGSPRQGGNCYILLQEALEAAKEVAQGQFQPLETEIIQFADLHIDPCTGCEDCWHEPYQCTITGDDFKQVYAAIKQADGLLIASPRYFLVVPAKLLAFMERLDCIHFAHKQRDPSFVYPMAGRPCGIMAIYGGFFGHDLAKPVLDMLFHFTLFFQMEPVFIPTWPHIGVLAKGWGKGQVHEDNRAIQDARVLGCLIAEKVRKLQPDR